MFLVRVLKILNLKKIRYLVVGGVAAIFYGNPRFTKDLDIWVDCGEENLKRLVLAFKSLGFQPRNPVKAEDFISRENRARWKKEKGMLAFTFLNPKVLFESVDLLFEGPVSFSQAYEKKRLFKAKNIVIPTISCAHLIQMKKKAGRYQDLEDVKIIKAASRKQGRE